MSGLSRARIALRTLLSDELIERSADRVLRQGDGVGTGSREGSRAESAALEEVVV